jgi:cyanophycinase-like exopeptidase
MTDATPTPNAAAPAASLICLQGGAEFGPRCRTMDAELVALAAERRPGPVVIATLAGAPGREYDIAGANGVRHFTGLGVGADALSAPDARSEPAAAESAWRSASLLVLPGGSPARLLTALRSTGFDRLLIDLLGQGTVVMGASAGAMVLCARTWLPERGSVDDGLGVIPDTLVLPHWDPRRSAPKGIGDSVSVLGVPEQSGVLCVGGVPVRSMGAGPSTVIAPDGARRLLPASD